MKKINLIVFLFFTYTPIFSQTILDYFQLLPDSALMNLTKKERELIVTHAATNKTNKETNNATNKNKPLYFFEICDVKNGYVKLIGAFEGHLTMCYWNLANSKKLIAIYQESCGPACAVDQFYFYEYDGKTFYPKSKQLIMPDVHADFYKGDEKTISEEMNKQDIIASLLFELPQTGKNILVKWGNEDSQKTYQKYAVGDRMNLVWNNGTFKKGKIYWKN